MPLPAALLAKLQKRGIVKEEPKPDMFEDVMDYVEDTLVPYYKTCIGNLMPTSIIKEKEVGRFNVEVINGSTATLVKSIELAMKKETMAAFLGVQDPTDKVKAPGGSINKTVRLEGKPCKCFLLPKTAFPAQTWEDFINIIYGIDDADSTEADEIEEVFAEDYDDPVKEAEHAKPADIPEPTKEEEDGPIMYQVPACPNRVNKYHSCSDYCKERWGMREFIKEPDMIRKRDRMLRKYPLPDNWIEVADPETNRFYYWNLVTDQVSWLSPLHPSAHITLSADKIQAILGDSANIGSQDDELHFSDEEEMDANDSGSSLSSSSSSESDSDEEFDRKRQRGRNDRQNDRGRGRGGNRRNQNRKDELDPMDPASYSEVPRGTWSTGLERGNEAKTGADTTASGPLFQQRPYPSPGEILRRNQANKK